MSWDYKISERALKQLKKLDKQAAALILRYLDERIVGTHDPRQWHHWYTCYWLTRAFLF